MRAEDTERSRILLLDDDPLFGHTLAHLAGRRGIRLDVLESLLELESLDDIQSYKAAIIDMNLGSISGEEIGRYLSAFFHETPFILISGDRLIPEDEWPDCARLFVSKGEGLSALLDAVEDTVSHSHKTLSAS
jgi:DNA-binding NtrC family response regulator